MEIQIVERQVKEPKDNLHSLDFLILGDICVKQLRILPDIDKAADVDLPALFHQTPSAGHQFYS